jgi:hypothetical protein
MVCGIGRWMRDGGSEDESLSRGVFILSQGHCPLGGHPCEPMIRARLSRFPRRLTSPLIAPEVLCR